MSERERICLVIPYYEAGDDLTTTLGSVRLRADDLIVVVDDGSRRLPARDVAPPTHRFRRLLPDIVPLRGRL